MNRIELNDIAKRYSENWIFSNLTLNLTNETIWAIKGPNGSGKSTLIKILAGFLSPSLGDVVYEINDNVVDRDSVFRHISWTGPHSSLLQHMKIEELVNYYFVYKNLRRELSIEDFYRLCDLPVAKHQFVNSLSSGQNQKLGLALSILCDSEILLLDEPGSFLDKTAHSWFVNLLRDFASDRLVIISSNDDADLTLCNEVIDISKFKSS